VVLLLIACGAASLLVGGCGGGRRAEPESDSQLELDREDLVRADRLFANMQREHDLHRDGQALQLGFELLDRYPSYQRRGEVARLAIASARRLGDVSAGRRLVAEFLAEQPESPYLPEVLAMGADLAVMAGDTLAGADALIRLHGTAAAPLSRDEIVGRLDTYLPALGAAELTELSGAHGGGQLGTYLGYHEVRALLLAGRAAAAANVVAGLRGRAPDDPWTRRAIELLAAPPSVWAAERLAGGVGPGPVGVICPLTGRYAVFGNAFADGAQLALDHVEALTRDTVRVALPLELRIEDSEGDPVAAALAARRLCDAGGCVAMIGALLSDPTATVALVCDRYGVPLVSPTATHDRLAELGEWVFQTNQTDVFETEVLTQLAVRVLLKRRFAVLHPADNEGERSAERFAAAVTAWGGEVVARAAFPLEATDFREPIGVIRRARPEVVYVPATVDQMVLLGPQLDFYRAGALVLGPSEWNSARLLEEASTVMQRALFVSDTALFPAGWTTAFEADWNSAAYPPDATALALRSYQATRSVLESLLAPDQPRSRPAQLGADQRHRLTARAFEAEGPEAIARTVAMIEGEEIVAFPADIFRDTWQLVALADSASLADSLGTIAAPPDSLGAGDSPPGASQPPPPEASHGTGSTGTGR
jgi:ABC-type branched-subunit amino acid transport system substrate-binding protein